MQVLEDALAKARTREDEARRYREEVEQHLHTAQQQEITRQEAEHSRAHNSASHDSNSSNNGAEANSTHRALSNTPPGVKKPLAKKRSKGMAAMAAGAGLRHIASPTAAPAPTHAPPPPPSSASISAINMTAATLVSYCASRDGQRSLDLADADEARRGRSLRSDEASTSRGVDQSYDVPCEAPVVPKPIFIISDCTGESAARTVRAALNQFEMRCHTTMPANLMIFRFLEDQDRLHRIILDASKENALVVYSLVDPKMVGAVQSACKAYKVRYVDLWSTLLDNMEGHLKTARSGIPMTSSARSSGTISLTDDYFKFIEAVEFTRKMDDGANAKEWKNADLLILGVSRCGKTPLSIYLGQRGYKVANLPLVPNCPLPKELYEIDQDRVVGLTIDPNVLSSIRRNRLGMMGIKQLTGVTSIEYAELQKVNEELAWATALYRKNPQWPVLDVTLRGIEETAGRILKILNDRRGDSSPMWVEELHKSAASSGADNSTPTRSTPEVSTVWTSCAGAYMQGLY